MEGTWTVFDCGEAVGQCWGSREGLYTRFSCRCALQDGGIHDLLLRIGNWQQSLGVLVPSAGAFVLDTRLVSRQLPEGTPEFSVRPRGTRADAFIPVVPEEPFAYLTRLEKAYLVRRGDQVGLTLRM